MFVQAIRGKVKDKGALRAQMDKWQKDVGPGAKGWLGVTAGVGDDGTHIAVVRFESEQAAQANSDRPEQGEWWKQTEALFDGAPEFFNCPQVDVWGSPSDDAGFVQVMIGKTNDVAGMRKMGATFDKEGADMRPDVLGSLDAYTKDGTFVSPLYFRTEAEAREGEKKMESDPKMQEMMQEFGGLFDGDMSYIDLRDPWLVSP